MKTSYTLSQLLWVQELWVKMQLDNLAKSQDIVLEKVKIYVWARQRTSYKLTDQIMTAFRWGMFLEWFKDPSQDIKPLQQAKLKSTPSIWKTESTPYTSDTTLQKKLRDIQTIIEDIKKWEQHLTDQKATIQYYKYRLNEIDMIVSS